MECERKAEMTDEERVREMVTHTVANVVETLGQALLETREIMPSNREAIIDFLREAEGHCWVARVIDLGDHSDKQRFDVKITLPSDYDAELDHPLSVAADIAKRMEANEPGSIAVICTLSEVQVLLHQNARLREELADVNNAHADNEVDLLLTAIGITQHTYEPRHICINRARDEATRLNGLDKQNARLREEVAALKRNRLAAFTQKECADVATVLGDYLQQTDQEKAFLEEWKAELQRREANNEQ